MTAPALFIGHGSPMEALEQDGYTEALAAWAGANERPRAIVVVSAHWQDTRVAVTAAARPPMIYDFGGFPPKLSRIVYACPGEPALAREVAALTGAELELGRGLDHGVWVPLHRMYPRAQIPVVELSLPEAAPAVIGELGARLVPLRERGVMLVGAGGVVHNLRPPRWQGTDAPPDDWAVACDDEAARAIEARDTAALERLRTSPLAVPTSEHFDPLFFTMGAAMPDDDLEWIYEGIYYGNLSMRSFALTGDRILPLK